MKACLLFSLVLCMFHLTYAFHVYIPDCVDSNGNELICLDDFTCQKDDYGVGECVPMDALMSPQSVCPSPEDVEAQEMEAGQIGEACESDLDCPLDKVCCYTNSGRRCANMILQAMVIE
ncbi:hypothetical protein CHS0354_017826 [Potamilus streckersoni]|uniref:WAP domain-containing protein n=1 Tax=Potamilus streckersoni TaxID=2493646 RepID=A0AAE0T9S1_9BIVA|nr:hypothetical protein CHS0354_017826 [Potamilus streckersoni]